METKEIWIEKIINSTEGIAKVAPNDDLLSKIQQRIKEQEKVAPQTIWLVAASILVLVLLNITALKTKVTTQQETTISYMSETLNQNNQLYQ